MTPTTADKKHLTLSELLRRITRTVAAAPDLQRQWVAAEVIDLRGSGGHVYFSLIQKDEAGQPVATMRCNLWRGTLQGMLARYGETLRQVLRNGRQVRLLASASFHEKYGLTLTVHDVDIEYGADSAQVQARILAALQKEGILEKNKERPMPWPVQRVAVISSPGAAGYGDFMNQITGNRAGIVFYTCLFEAVMQGVNTSESVRGAIARVESAIDLFDAIVIIRGGGATSDLAGFDDLALARAVALCGLPVIVGIGHERDNTVLDYIAHTRVKTPTAAAEWLVAQGEQALSRAIELATTAAHEAKSRLLGDTRHVDHLSQMAPLLARAKADKASQRLSTLAAAIPLAAQQRTQGARTRLQSASHAVESAASQRLAKAGQYLNLLPGTIRYLLKLNLSRQGERLKALDDKVALLSPQNVLARGYSLTLTPEGRALRRAACAPPGTRLLTRLQEGEVESRVL